MPGGGPLRSRPTSDGGAVGVPILPVPASDVAAGAADPAGCFMPPPTVLATAIPASSPSTAASPAPPTPQTSPAANTPGTDVRPAASTRSTANPCGSATVSQPSPTASSTWGTKPHPTARTSTSTDRARCVAIPPEPSIGATVTLRSTSSPSARTTVHLLRYGMRCRTRTLAYPAPSNSFPPAPVRARSSLSHRRAAAASYTPTTSAPRRARPVATDSRNGPVPATATRRPASTPCPFSSDCTPPAVITPGRSHPGNGTCRS